MLMHVLMPRRRLRWAVQLVVVLHTALCCLLATASPSWETLWPVPARASASQVVYSPAQFVAALADDAVGTIHLGQDLLMSEETWPAEVVRVRRNVSVDGRQHFVNFTRVRDKVLLEPGVHLTLRHINLAGAFLGSFLAFVKESPDAFLWLRDSTYECPNCPPLKKFLAMIAALPRPSGYAGRQHVSTNVLPVCLRAKCYPLALTVHEFAVDMYPVSYSDSKLRAKYTALKWNLTWACDTVTSDSCVVNKGYDLCRVELVEAQARGFTHAYDRRTYETYVRCAVALGIVVLGAVWWLVAHARRVIKARGCRTFSLPDWPLRPDPSHSVFSSSSGDLKDAVTLESILGSGSFGSVYRGTWRYTSVAVKVILHDSVTAVKVAREASIGLRLEHPHVVRTLHQMTIALKNADLQRILPGSSACQVLTQHTHSGHSTKSSDASSPHSSQQLSTWIVQELCDLGTLTDHLKHLRDQSSTGQVKMDLIMSYALDVAQGMAYLHGQGVCHGDLKARNVLVMTDVSTARGDVVKVADFGVSQCLDNDRSHLSTVSLGTISHMPPELLEFGKLTRECDVYSFGILLHEIITGEPLYRGLTAAQVINQVSAGERPLFPPHVPAGLAGLARECWAQEPSRRPTFAAAAARLKGMLGMSAVER